MSAFLIITSIHMLCAGATPDERAEKATAQRGSAAVPESAYETRVHAKRVEEPSVEVLESMDAAPYAAASLADELNGVTGVSLVRRGPSGAEPVVRGLGWERVQTKVGILPLYGACPARMDPPVSYVGPAAFTTVKVVKGVPSVTLGPPGSGASLVLSTDHQHRHGVDPTFAGWVRSAVDSARGGGLAQGGVQGGTKELDYRATAEVVRLHRYETASGARVPGNHDAARASVALGYDLKRGHRLFGSVSYAREHNISYPALPMNTDDSAQLSVHGGYQATLGAGVLRGYEVTGGVAHAEHAMSNRNKPNRAALRAGTLSEVYSYGGQGKLQVALGATQLSLGADVYRLSRDAERQRTVVAQDRTFADHLWPDAMQWGAGLFVESRWTLFDKLNLRAGARVDRVSSVAHAADDPSLGGLTVAEQYESHYGKDAGEMDRQEVLAAANAVLELPSQNGVTAHLGIGVSSRPAGVTERYFAYAPAPGGFLVGNPALAAERKAEAELGVRMEFDALRLRGTVFYNQVADFIALTLLDRRDVDGDGAVDSIRGYENVDARLVGGELAVTFQLFKGISLPAKLTYVHATNLDRDDPLPEIPPLEGDAALRADVTLPVPMWLEVGARFAAAQDRVDTQYAEDRTPGFAVARVRAGFELFERWHLDLGIENLFNEAYHEHLTREVILRAGDLMPGDEIPAPGRSFFASVRVDV